MVYLKIKPSLTDKKWKKLLSFVFMRRFYATEPWIMEKILTSSLQKEIENSWKQKIYSSAPKQEECIKSEKKKKYILSMFPYPSGKLHLGHVRVYTISDAIARMYRMKGYEVIHPMGWDAFGLPAENAAMERGENPAIWTQENIRIMRKQLQDLGCQFDWSREVATCNPDYYKWTQFIFLKLYESGLAYKQEAVVNWDPVDKTVLANEQIDENGCSWRSGAKAEKKFLSQWFIKTTRLSKVLYDDLSDPSLEKWGDVRSLQRGWIGECNGYLIEMKIVDENAKIIDAINHLPLWITTPEYLGNVAFLAIKSDHFMHKYVYKDTSTENPYVLRIKAVNPLTKKLIPILVNDELEFENESDIYIGFPSVKKDKILCSRFGFTFPSEDVLNDGSDQSRRSQILTTLEKMNCGGHESSAKLKDWLISRQRYWGTPIPIVYCSVCGTVPVPAENLPVLLPNIKGSIEKGVAVLKENEEWLKCSCPKCGKEAIRETDTMDTFVDSSWYFLRYLDPNNPKELVGKDEAQNLMPVDLYIGGIEHAYLHLYYARFVHKFLTSIGIACHKEPFTQLLVQGMIKGQSYQVQKTGKYLRPEEVDFSVSPHLEKDTRLPLTVRFEKMSKSKYNGVDPQSLVEEFGADVVRLAVLSNASPQANRHWNSEDLEKSLEILGKLWRAARAFVFFRCKEDSENAEITEDERCRHENDLCESRNVLLQEASYYLEVTNKFQFHSIIKCIQRMVASILKLPKAVLKSDECEKSLKCCLLLLSPICPHLSAELWDRIRHVSRLKDLNQNASIFEEPWPTIDPSFNCFFLECWVDWKKVSTVRLTKVEFSELTEEKALQLAKNMESVSTLLSKKGISDIKLKSTFKAILDITTEAKAKSKDKGRKKKL